MSELPSADEKYAVWLKELAALINQQPQGERQRSRELIGDLLHDIKDTLGLITGANSILERELQITSDPAENSEMLKISNNAAMLLNKYAELISENFANQIDASFAECIDHLRQAVDIASYVSLTCLHPLDGWHRNTS